MKVTFMKIRILSVKVYIRSFILKLQLSWFDVLVIFIATRGTFSEAKFNEYNTHVIHKSSV